MSAEIIALPPRAPADLGADAGRRVVTMARALEELRPQPSPKPPSKRVSVDRHAERVRVIIDLADAWGIDLRMAVAMQGNGSWDRPLGAVPEAPSAAGAIAGRRAGRTKCRPRPEPPLIFEVPLFPAVPDDPDDAPAA
jgi:hypothetical protein